MEEIPKKAFTGKNSLKKNPILIEGVKEHVVPEKVKLSWLEDRYTIRKNIDKDLKVEKVIDVGIRKILMKRLGEYGGNKDKAFANLDKNPIWLDREKGIALKRVKIEGPVSVTPIREKKDHFGDIILDENGNTIPTDYVQLSNNHHTAIYRDQDGNLQDEVVSFFDAVVRKKNGSPVVKKNHEEGWEFLFSLKNDEFFVFPDDDFDPSQVDLENPDNKRLISPHLFYLVSQSKVTYGETRVIRNYHFRNHLMASTDDPKELKNKTFKLIKGLKDLEGAIKVRLNHLGDIVHVGEY